MPAGFRLKSIVAENETATIWNCSRPSPNPKCFPMLRINMKALAVRLNCLPECYLLSELKSNTTFTFIMRAFAWRPLVTALIHVNKIKVSIKHVNMTRAASERATTRHEDATLRLLCGCLHSYCLCVYACVCVYTPTLCVCLII